MWTRYSCTHLVFADCDNPTYGGNAKGSCCVLPFIYKDTLFDKCTKNDHTKNWCSTTSNYDLDGEWGNCVGEYIQYHTHRQGRTLQFCLGGGVNKLWTDCTVKIFWDRLSSTKHNFLSHLGYYEN